MLLAAVKDEAMGEAFLVSGEEPATWREMFGRFERMLGGEPRTVDMTEAEALATGRSGGGAEPRLIGEGLRIVKQEQRIRERLERPAKASGCARWRAPSCPRAGSRRSRAAWPPAGNRVLSAPDREAPIHPLPPKMIGFFRARTRVRIDKAKRLLGYRPAFDFETGMDLTERWARWANLL